MLTAPKAFARRALPAGFSRVLRDSWEDLRDWVGTFAFALSFALARKPRPKMLIYFGFALGDDLLCTAVLRELRKRGKDQLMMISDHPELFERNADPIYVRPLWARYYRDGSTASICRRFVGIWGGEFRRLEYAPPNGEDQQLQPSRHIVAEMCARAGVTGQISIRPYLALSNEEEAEAGWARGHIVIQSSGMAARHPMRNKQWPDERFQSVIDALKEEFAFIQLGSSTDPTLRHAKDLRGLTEVRASAAILHHARLYIGTVGFLMHVARAVECPSVIIFGGREAPWQTGYVCNTNLYSAVPCAPCWRSNTCDFDRRCMTDISVADVVAAIRTMMERSRNPLAVERVEIAAESASSSSHATSRAFTG
jgi:Glycosyltransferase family 9 (heptosyltransferase)